MKAQLVTILAAAALSTILGSATAGDKELDRNDVPKAVLEAFEKAFPNVKKMEFETERFEGQTAYEVEYKDNGKEYEVLYSADGVLLQKEEEIDVEALSQAVIDAIKKEHPQAQIEEAEKMTKPDGTLAGYEVEIKEGGNKLELEVDADGTILKTGRD